MQRCRKHGGERKRQIQANTTKEQQEKIYGIGGNIYIHNFLYIYNRTRSTLTPTLIPTSTPTAYGGGKQTGNQSLIQARLDHLKIPHLTKDVKTPLTKQSENGKLLESLIDIEQKTKNTEDNMDIDLSPADAEGIIHSTTINESINISNEINEQNKSNAMLEKKIIHRVMISLQRKQMNFKGKRKDLEQNDIRYRHQEAHMYRRKNQRV